MKLIALSGILSLFIMHESALAADCPTAATLLAESQQAGTSLQSAESKLREVLEKCPDLAEGHFQFANVLLKLGKATEAKKSFERAVHLKRDPLFLVGLGTSYLELKDESNAENSFEDALKADSNSAKAMQALSVLSFRQGKKNRAEELLRKAIQVNPEDASLFFNLGIVLADTNRNDEAIESFRAATERKSPYPEALIQLGSAQLRAAQYELAEKAFRAASLHEPKNSAIWTGLGAAQDGMGSYDLAMTSFEKALSFDPKYPLAKLNWGIASVKNGDKKKGIAKLKELSAEAPDSAAAHAALGWALLQQKDLDGAKSELEAALKLDPNDALALNNLGVLFQLKGDTARAKEIFERAQETGAVVEEVKANLNGVKD